jgi:ADP-ribose pyrophosphatase YjhB (NUDIX family)
MSLITAAVAAVIRDPAGHVLLCQQSQGHRLWGLPGGRIRNGESPVAAVVRDIREETGTETEVDDLVGIYQLTGDGYGTDLPDVLVHVFRARLAVGDVAVNSPGRICRLSWHDPDDLPQPLTATARVAVDDAVAGRSGVLRDVHRVAEPDIPDAVDMRHPADAPSIA